MSNRTYYRGPDAVVTDRLFVWHTTPTRGFVVRDLQNVGFVSEPDRFRPYLARVAGGALVLVVATGLMLETPPTYAVGFLAFAMPIMLTAAFWRMPPRRWELRATYRGHEVILYASSDTRVFNQVRRALRRAVEDARPVAGYHLAS